MSITPEEAKIVAKEAHLRYVTDTRPGIQRKRSGKGFTYIGLDGQPIKDRQERERLDKIGIPPAWTDVWISPYPNGHILTTGRDAKGRKQYRYHPDWNAIRNETKFSRMVEFGKCLPKIREMTEKHIQQPELTREKILAAVVRLLEKTLIRIGNMEYARDNEHYGLTTMKDDHVAVKGERVRFEFVGKSGQEHSIDLYDKRLARIIKESQEIEGYDLFQYYDEQGHPHAIGSGDVNTYLREITGENFSAKDFRTWGGSVLAVNSLCELPECETETEAKKNTAQAIKAVAKGLGNTPAVCRKYYVHPAVITAYADRSIHRILAKQQDTESKYGLSKAESALMELIQNQG